MSPLWQNALVYALVLWCVWRLLRKYLPGWSWQTQAKVSYFFESKHPAWLKRIGQKLRPALSIPQACNTHCSKCNTCS